MGLNSPNNMAVIPYNNIKSNLSVLSPLLHYFMSQQHVVAGLYVFTIAWYWVLD